VDGNVGRAFQIVRFEQVGRQPLLLIAAFAAVGSANLHVPKLRFCSLKLSTIYEPILPTH